MVSKKQMKKMVKSIRISTVPENGTIDVLCDGLLLKRKVGEKEIEGTWQ